MHDRTAIAPSQPTIHFVDLGRVHASMGDALETTLRRVIDEGGFTLGREVERFERSFADYIGVAHAVGCWIRHRRSASGAQSVRRRPG